MQRRIESNRIIERYVYVKNSCEADESLYTSILNTPFTVPEASKARDELTRMNVCVCVCMCVLCVYTENTDKAVYRLQSPHCACRHIGLQYYFIVFSVYFESITFRLVDNSCSTAIHSVQNIECVTTDICKGHEGIFHLSVCVSGGTVCQSIDR